MFITTVIVAYMAYTRVMCEYACLVSGTKKFLLCAIAFAPGKLRGFMDFLPHGHFAPWTLRPMEGHRSRPIDVSPYGRFAHGRFAPQTIRPKDAVNINKL